VSRRCRGERPLRALRSGPYLYVEAPRPELYDTEVDATETSDVLARLPRVAVRLRRELVSLVGELPAGPGADPKDALDLYLRYQSALRLERQRKTTESIVLSRSILAEAGTFVSARRRLSEDLLRDGQLAEARSLLEQIVSGGEATDVTYLNLALTCHRLGKADLVVEWLRKGSAAFPRSAVLHHRLGRILLEQKMPDDAARELAEAVALEPRFLDALLASGLASERRGRPQEAATAYRQILALSSRGEEAGEARDALTRMQVR